MASQPPFPVIPCVLFIIVISFISKRWWESRKRLPPGPPKFPLIGNLLQMISLSLPPHHVMTNLSKKYGPVMSLQLGEVLAVIVSSAKAAEEALKTKDLCFAGRPELIAVPIMTYGSSIAFAPYGDYWKNMRKICASELLHTKRVQSFRSVREETVWNLIEDVSKSEGVVINLSEKIFNVAVNIISVAAFSKRCEKEGEFMSTLDELLSVSTGFGLAELYPSLKFLRYVTGLQPALEKIHKKMDKILGDIIKEHKLKQKKETEHEDVVDLLLKYQQSNQLGIPITDDNIKGVILDIFSGGTETTGATIEWAMAELVKNPRVMKKAQAEVREALNGKTKAEERDIENLPYLKLIIKETLRLHPPVPLIPRAALQNSEIGGYQIPVKTKFLINAWGISRDPSIWEEPNSFKPERFLSCSIDFRGGSFEMLPFGSGRRICPGISFADAELDIVLAQLLYHFDWSLPGGEKPEELDMSERIGINARKKLDLHLVPKVNIPFTR